jgi:hypothetical protein
MLKQVVLKKAARENDTPVRRPLAGVVLLFAPVTQRSLSVAGHRP